MSACPTTCEEPSWLGAKGVCNNGTCFCPDGFSGKDDWTLYNDCRVNEVLQKGMWVLCLVSIFITLVISATGSIEIPVILAQLPLVGLPIGFVLIMAMLVTAIVERSRQNRD